MVVCLEPKPVGVAARILVQDGPVDGICNISIISQRRGASHQNTVGAVPGRQGIVRLDIGKEQDDMVLRIQQSCVREVYSFQRVRRLDENWSSNISHALVQRK